MVVALIKSFVFRSALLAWVLWGAAGASGQSFVPGDLYLVSNGLPRAGTGTDSGIVRIQPGAYTVSRVYTGISASAGRATYDAFRQRIVVGSQLSGLFLLAANGSSGNIAVNGSALLPAATGDGRIYFVRTGGAWGTLEMVDGTGAVFDVLDQAGAAVAALTTSTYATFWDATTQSLLLGQERAGGDNGLERITFTDDGRRILTRTQMTFTDPSASELIVGFSAGPNGTVFIALDDNTNSTTSRLKTVDVATMTVSSYAVTGYTGVGGEVAGAYMPTIDAAVALDSFANELRVYTHGAVGAGVVVATAGVSTNDGSGETAQFIVIAPPSPRCSEADFDCDGDVGTDADIEAFFACIAGRCPPPPCTSSADFNADGDSATDADIESFFRVLAGGHC